MGQVLIQHILCVRRELRERKYKIQVSHDKMRQPGVSSLSRREITFLCRALGFSANAASLTLLTCQVWLECVERSTICVYKALDRLGWRTARNRHPCSIFLNHLHFGFIFFSSAFCSHCLSSSTLLSWRGVLLLTAWITKHSTFLSNYLFSAIEAGSVQSPSITSTLKIKLVIY